jgi:hypothetical protein
MGEWAAEQSKETLKKLGSKYGKPPSERTYRRVLSSLDVKEVDRQLGKWVAEQQTLIKGTGLAIDGKTLRGSGDGKTPAIHLLSAIVHGSGTVVAQIKVESHTNEIPNVIPMLEDVEMAGTVVTADALLTQREIAKHLVEEKDADYVLIVKNNQPTLRKDIEDCFAIAEQDAKSRQPAFPLKPPAMEAFPPSPEQR